uniref:Uncharacterized protein n=1 Tax=Arundo donax TaxID=35708 RepID=A0A0A9DJ41_ARUDO
MVFPSPISLQIASPHSPLSPPCPIPPLKPSARAFPIGAAAALPTCRRLRDPTHTALILSPTASNQLAAHSAGHDSTPVKDQRDVRAYAEGLDSPDFEEGTQGEANEVRMYVEGLEDLDFEKEH